MKISPELAFRDSAPVRQCRHTIPSLFCFARPVYYTVESTFHLNRDSPFGFLPTTGAGGFRDFLPAPWICKPFFQSAPVFSPAHEVSYFSTSLPVFRNLTCSCPLKLGLREKQKRFASGRLCYLNTAFSRRAHGRRDPRMECLAKIHARFAGAAHAHGAPAFEILATPFGAIVFRQRRRGQFF